MNMSLEIEKYKKYINSPEWKQKAAFIRHLDKNTCRICGFIEGKSKRITGLRDDSKYLEVHHLTYERLFTELLSDLVTLCQACHGDISRLKKSDSITLDRALDEVSKKFGKTAKKVKSIVLKRSSNVKWFHSEVRTPKPTNTNVFAVCGLYKSGIFLDAKAANGICIGNKYGKCRKFKREIYARKWIDRRLHELKLKGKNPRPEAFVIDGLQSIQGGEA